MRTPEGKTKKQIVDWLRSKGAYVFAPVQQGFGASTLDLLVCWQGDFVAIEVKAPGRKPTARQNMIANQIHDAQGMAFVATSLTDVTDVLATDIRIIKP